MATQKIVLQLEEKPVQMLQFIKQLHTGFDITGEDWDWGTYFESPETFEECNDYYDKFMYLIACNVYVIQFKSDWYTITTIEQFIREHVNTFKKFINENWREECIPNWETIEEDSEDWYEIFIDDLFEPLFNGQYCESHYKELYDLLMEEK